ncbi:hypothetical protein AVEN_9057-1 [Araneus ventricosus]|uniref:Uncharacterized protein n=1 Tax=Araneus ventricosus TaxID=182803 RepID=A0A4Y2MNY6_ARAVE|nr:hypothetical protein AVEN_9057-1 [Araneus ventricosus]
MSLFEDTSGLLRIEPRPDNEKDTSAGTCRYKFPHEQTERPSDLEHGKSLEELGFEFMISNPKTDTRPLSLQLNCTGCRNRDMGWCSVTSTVFLGHYD